MHNLQDAERLHSASVSAHLLFLEPFRYITHEMPIMYVIDSLGNSFILL